MSVCKESGETFTQAQLQDMHSPGASLPVVVVANSATSRHTEPLLITSATILAVALGKFIG